MKKVIVGALLLLIGCLYAGGWDNEVMGVRQLGMGSIFAGIADDATAIFYNPAGILSKNLDVIIEGVAQLPKHSYFSDALGKTIYSKKNSIIPQLFFTYKLNDKAGLGLGVYAPYGGGVVGWKKEDLGMLLESGLAVYTLTPTLAYQLTPNLSIGVKGNIYYGFVMQKKDTLIGTITDTIDVNAKGPAFSGGLGILWENDKIGIGLSVRGPAKIKLSGTYDSKQMGEHDIDMEFNLPTNILFGIGYKVTSNLTLGIDAEYSMWSALDIFKTTIKEVTTPLGTGDLEQEDTLDFENTLKIKAGGEYTLSNGLALRFGAAYDKYSIPDKSLDPVNIDVDKYVVFSGFGYTMNKVQLNLSFLYAMGQEREVTEEVAPGVTITSRYNLNAFVIGAGIRYSF